jgi:hypothetical protein
MTIYRNKNWTERNYEVTNIRYQIATNNQPRNFNTGEIDPVNWEPISEEDDAEALAYEELGLDYCADALGLDHIGTLAGNRFYGHI